MMRVALWSLIPTLALSFALSGCGTADPKNDATDGGARLRPPGALLPWKTGNSWTYRVTDDGEISTKVTTIGDLEAVGGTGPHQAEMAYKVVTKKGVDGTDQTISWQNLTGDKVIRYREQSFSASSGMLELEEHWDPYKLHIDGSAEHTVTGASWIERYSETKLPVGGAPTTNEQRDPWSCDVSNESVTVPAGTFDAVIVRKAGSSSLKTYWYVPGVGKVKETGGQIEELLSFSLAP